jgi:2-methylcitrate dehydratase PrpD
MENMSISEQLASHLRDINYEKLPSSSIKKAKLCILDLLGAHFAGHELESCGPVKRYASSLHGEAQATVWSTAIRTAVSEAAFANSAVAHVTVFDDMHAGTASHYGSMVIPAAIAVGEHLKSSGRDLIAAVVSGYEAGIRVGSAIYNSYFSASGFRPSGTFGPFASAAAAGKLFGLDFNQMVNAIGLAGNFGVGLMAFANAGTDDLMYQNALASRNGVLSALLAAEGAISPRRIFEISGGFFKVYGGGLEGIDHVAGNLNSDYKIEEVYFKGIPACAFVQSAAMATLDIAEKKDFAIDDVDHIDVRVFPQGKHYPGLDYCGPYHGVMQAQMSNPYTIASILINGTISFEDYTKLEDPRVYSLSKKVNIFEDEEAKSRWPAEQLVKVEVVLKDGSSRKATSKNPKFLEPDEVIEKCRLYLRGALDEDASLELIEAVQTLETLDNVQRLTDIIRNNLKAAKKGDQL